MDCIFCHNNSDNSNSVEHIIPESLGNKNIILWKGAVCDACNNYFARKIEKELLEQSYFISLRHRKFIKNKRGHLIPQTYLSPQLGEVPVLLDYDQGGYSVCFEDNPYTVDNGPTNNIISRISAIDNFSLNIMKYGFVTRMDYFKLSREF
jgi:hypothetical protein